MDTRLNFISGEELLTICDERNISISEAMIIREEEYFGVSREIQYDRIKHSWNIMKESATKALKEDIVSMGGLIGGEAKRLNARRQTNLKSPTGDIIRKGIMYAMGVLEVNASMGLIVAAPTAGASGVIPGSFLAIMEELDFTDDDMISALFHAGAVGYLIAYNATISGAEGGCQAEVGSASAMAASAITELLGGTPRQCLSAAASAMSNLLGLVCDPIGGLVEAPCQQRNAMGVSNALIASEIALSGVMNVIPFDEVVAVMYSVGKAIPHELRETALGGLATAPSACGRCKGCS